MRSSTGWRDSHGKIFAYDMAKMQALGESCSRYERRAEDATRDAADWLKCEFLQKHIGEQFDGVVTSVTNFGLFVRLDDLLVDGLVHVTALKRDYYHFDAGRHELVGETNGWTYTLGDRLTVEVVRVDLEDRKIDFDLIRQLDVKKRRSAKISSRRSAFAKSKKNKSGVKPGKGSKIWLARQT